MKLLEYPVLIHEHRILDETMRQFIIKYKENEFYKTSRIIFFVKFYELFNQEVAEIEFELNIYADRSELNVDEKQQTMVIEEIFERLHKDQEFLDDLVYNALNNLGVEVF